jgi:hypothetical protein
MNQRQQRLDYFVGYRLTIVAYLGMRLNSVFEMPASVSFTPTGS